MRGGMGNMFFLQHNTTTAVGFATYLAMFFAANRKQKSPCKMQMSKNEPASFFFATMS